MSNRTCIDTSLASGAGLALGLALLLVGGGAAGAPAGIAGTAAGAATAAPTAPAAPETTEAPPTPRPRLTIDRIDLVGNTRTPARTVALYFPLAAGDRVDQDGLLAALRQLRDSDLFASVRMHAEPAAGRGHVVVVLEVVEKRPLLELGTGYSDLDGWYLIPLRMSLDNSLGRGERLGLQVELGYRRSGVALDFLEPRVGDGRTYWGWRAAALTTDRVYFLDGIEYAHGVERRSAGVRLGRRLGRGWFAEVGMALADVEADSSAEVHRDDEARGVEEGDDLPWDRLPGPIARAAGSRERSLLHLDLGLDTRSPALLAGSPRGGFWGRIRTQGCLQGDDSFLAVGLDLRGYAPVLRGVAAVRLRADAVGPGAVFYDRLYLGGLYTVRGYPSQSLSRPEGDRWRWTASLEYRAPLIGERALPRLAGLLFLDAGAAGSGIDPTLRDAKAGAGWGVRLRLPWLGWLGLDAAVPLSPSPVDESFRLHGSIGWTF